MSKGKKTNHVATFEQYGVGLVVDQTEKNAVGDCPFCGHNALSVKLDTGQWRCWQCKKQGNTTTFVRQLWQDAYTKTTPTHYKNLASLRPGLNAGVLEEMKVAYDGGTWLLPAFEGDGLEPATVYLWTPKEDGEKAPVYATANSESHLYNAIKDELDSAPDAPIYLCEGFWDTAAMKWVLKRTKSPGIPIGVPGEAIWKTRWQELFHRRNVWLLYDNSTNASRYMQKVCQQLDGIAYGLKYIEWAPGIAEGFDIRDLVVESGSKPRSVLNTINKSLVEYQTTSDVVVDHPSKWKRERETPRPDFKKVLKLFNKYYHFDVDMENALSVMMASVVSNAIPGDPVWSFLVGQPGAGKTAMLKATLGTSKCHYISTVTSQTLVSGYSAGVSDTEDPSLLPRLRYRCLVVKDFTEIMGAPTAVRDELYATLRGAYDGYVCREYGNFSKRVYDDLYFSLVAGVTHAIHAHRYTALGERFLKYICIKDGHDNIAHIRSAIDGMEKKAESDAALKDIVGDFLDVDPIPKFPKPPPWLKERVIYLSTLIAMLRASVARGQSGELSYRPVPEVGTRISTQLIKLGQSLCFVWGKNTIDMEVYQLMYQVAMDTAYGWHLDTFFALLERGDVASSVVEVMSDVRCGKSTAQRCLNDMAEIGVANKTKASSFRPGNKDNYYALTDDILNLWEKVRCDTVVRKAKRGKSGSVRGTEPGRRKQKGKKR